MVSEQEALIIKFPLQALSPSSSILHRKTQSHTNNSNPKVPNCKPLFWCYIVSFLHCSSSISEQPIQKSDPYYFFQTRLIQIKHTNTIKSSKKFQTTQINGHERDRIWRERRQSDFKIVRENRIGAFCDISEQREKPIGVGHGRSNSTQLSLLHKLAANPLLMGVTVSASSS